MNKVYLFCFLFLCVQLHAQQSIMYDGELNIKIINSYSELKLNFEATLASASHWDFDNNLITNSNYIYQQNIIQHPNTNVYFNWEIGTFNGMAKGLYYISVKNEAGDFLAGFNYDLRTTNFCISADLIIKYNVNDSTFYYDNGEAIDYYVTAWNNIPCLGPFQITDLFEPRAPKNLSVYNYSGYPFVTWNNNIQEDYYTNVDVYRCFTYMNEPDSFTKIAELSANVSSYYDGNFRVGDYGSYKVFYKVCKRNNQKNSQFSNYASIGAVPRYKIGEGNNLAEKQSTEDESKNRDILYQNFPNPFNPMTELSFELKEPSKIKLEVLDILGRVIEEIVDGNYAKGKHNIKFAVRNLPSGIYFYRLNTGSNIFTKKMIISK